MKHTLILKNKKVILGSGGFHGLIEFDIMIKNGDTETKAARFMEKKDADTMHLENQPTNILMMLTRTFNDQEIDTKMMILLFKRSEAITAIEIEIEEE